MPIIPKEQIEQIRFQSNIIDVVGSYLPALRRRGATFKCNCPFHQEKTPSFTVNESRQIFHCFGCGIGGDVFRFVMEYEKVDFVTSVKILADRSNIEIIYEGGSSEKSGNKDELYRIHQDAAAYYHQLLVRGADGAEARRYMQERDLPMEIIKSFQLGFAPDEWDGLLSRALKKGYKEEHIESAGLVVPTEKGYYDRFRNRIMFPITDQMSRVIGFSGRIMNKAQKSAKYVNSPETLLFHKSRVLFAFDKARKPIVEKRQAIVVEGQIDAIRCHQFGLNNVVASQGTALTKNHAQLIKRYADEVVLLLDADAAGIKAALASSEIFIAHELSVRVAALPEGEDPDSLIKVKGPEAVIKLVDEAVSALHFLIECLSAREDMSTEAGRMRVVKAALNLISTCPAASRRDEMILSAANLLNISKNALLQDARREQRVKRQTPLRPPQETEKAVRVPKKYPLEEISLLELLVHHYHKVHPLVHDYLPAYCIANPICRELIEFLMVDLPESLMEIFHDYDQETQEIITKVQVQESRTIDSEMTPEELAQKYISLFWEIRLGNKQKELATCKELSGAERFYEQTRLKHDIASLKKDWSHAIPIIEAHLENP